MKIIRKKRRREKATNYLKRKKLLEGRKPRIVIRKSNKYLIIQYVESSLAQDKVNYSVSSKDLLKKGWPKDKSGSLKSLGACYLTGLLFGKKIIENKENKPMVLDTGLIRSTKGSRIYAALKGIVDAGVKIEHNPDVFPDEKRVKVNGFFEEVKSKI